MDDLDHSVYIAEQDWVSFFQESEECDLQQGALAGLDESGLSDFDEADFCLSQQEVQPNLELGPLGSHSTTDSLSDLEGLPLEPHESAKVLQGAEDALAAGGHDEARNVFLEKPVTSGDDENSAELGCAEEADTDLGKDYSLDKAQEAMEQAGECCAAGGREVYQETARNCADATGSTSREAETQRNAIATINLSAEPLPQGETATHASNCSDVKPASASLQASNEHGHCRDPCEGEFYSVLKGSQEEMNMELGEAEAGWSSLASPSCSFSDPRKDSQMDGEVQSDIPASAQHLSDHAKAPRKEKERWFVTVNVGRTHSREKTWPPAKKKRRKKSCSEDGPELGSGSEGQDPDSESNSGRAERLGVSETQSQGIDSDHEGYSPVSRWTRSSESAKPTTSTIAHHHELKNHSALDLTREPLPVFPNDCEFEEHKVNCQKSQHVDNHQEQQKVSIRSYLQVNAAFEGKSALKQQNDTSQPIGSVVSRWTEPSKPIVVESANPPNHQNLMMKLLFSSQSDAGCEMFVFCRDSDRDYPPFSRDERAAQDDAETKSQSKNHPLSQTVDMPQKCREHRIFSTETYISTESPEFSNAHVFDHIPGTHSLHKCLCAEQLDDLECKTFLPEGQQIMDVPKPSGLLVCDTDYGSGELDQSADFVIPDEVHNSSEIQKDPEQQANKSKNEPMYSEDMQKSIACLYTDERGHTSEKYANPERDSTLSATANTMPLTATRVNLCLLTADQQSIEKKSYLEPATLHLVDTGVSNECTVDLSPNESSVMTMLKNTISPSPERNNDNFVGDDLCLINVNKSQANSAENLSTQMFPEFLHPPLDPIKDEVHEMDCEETLSGDNPAAGLSTESPECNSQSVMEDEPGLHKEPEIVTGDLESRDPDPTLDSTRPVYAISSFWDEMEKLTINDILHLRLVGNARHPSEFPHLQDVGVADVSDAADSGYFAHPDDSKQDRWTRDTSRFSDFDDEFQQNLSASVNPSPEPQDPKSPVLWLPEPSEVWWESEEHPTPMGSGNDAGGRTELPSEDAIPQNPISAGPQSFKAMCKAVSVQNLQTLEEEELSSSPLPGTVAGDDERCMLFSLPQRPVEPCSLGLMEHENDVRSSSLPVLSGKSSPDSCVITFNEISQHFSGEDEAETSPSDRASPIVCSLPETRLSGRASPISYTLSEISLSGRASPIVTLHETSLSGRDSPISYTLSEMSLSGRASPIVYSLSETSLSERGSPISNSFSAMSLSGRASPIVVSLSETSLSGRSSPIVSFCDRAPNQLSLPETYDYFFSDFEVGSIFLPPVWSLSNRTNTGVPIFSCSRSKQRKFRFVEEYDFIFPEESSAESEDEDRHTPIHMVTCFDNQPHEPLDALVGPNTYEHFFIDKDWRGNLFPRNLLSLRRLRFMGGLYSSPDRSISWAFATTGWRETSSLFSTANPGNTTEDQVLSPPHPNLFLENQLCNEFREQRDTDMQAVVSFPKKGFLFTLRQSDICLVCIAFASWVLKSANPQSQDTWKTALLANVSAISAIQYLRRYMREDSSEDRR